MGIIPNMGKVFIYGQIGLEVQSKEVVKEILSAKGSLEVHINSPGGNVYEGLAIYNALQSKRNILRTYIDGLAYSAASWLAVSAKPENRFMSKQAQFGIHQALQFAGGNKEDLEKQLETLNKIDEMQIEIYHHNTGISADRIKEIMKRDTPLSFQESQEFGFQEYQPEKIAALFEIKNDMEKPELLKSIQGFLNGDSAPKKIADDVDKEIKDAKEKAESTLDSLYAEFTPQREFKEHITALSQAFEKMLSIYEALPSSEKIEEMIEAKASEKVAAFAAQVRTKATIPADHELNLETVPEPSDKARENFHKRIQELESKFK